MKIGCQMEKSGKTGVWWYRAFVGKTRYRLIRAETKALSKPEGSAMQRQVLI